MSLFSYEKKVIEIPYNITGLFKISKKKSIKINLLLVLINFQINVYLTNY